LWTDRFEAQAATSAKLGGYVWPTTFTHMRGIELFRRPKSRFASMIPEEMKCFLKAPSFKLELDANEPFGKSHPFALSSNTSRP
jgi:hypothetical protein